MWIQLSVILNLLFQFTIIIETTETESVTSYSDITEENINLWKDLKDPHMKDVQYV